MGTRYAAPRGQTTGTSAGEAEEQVPYVGLRAQKTPPPGTRPWAAGGCGARGSPVLQWCASSSSPRRRLHAGRRRCAVPRCAGVVGEGAEGLGVEGGRGAVDGRLGQEGAGASGGAREELGLVQAR